MDSIQDRRLVLGENDPDYQALVKMWRQSNFFSMLFWSCFFLSSVPFILYLLLCITEQRPVAYPGMGQLILFLPGTFGILAILSGRVGERILDWKDFREARKQTEELISQLTEKNRH